MRPARLATAVLTVLCLGATACATPDRRATPGGPTTAAATPVTTPDVSLSALDDPAADGLPEPLVDPAEIRSGGPPPDGIPAIDAPTFLPDDEVDFLEPDELVLALSLGGERRAYPIQIMVWHEIVNDTVADVPVTVTYCPLCNSAVAFDRRVDGTILDFGTSGMLYQSALVMYDRQTESLWSHFTGQAIAGTLTGKELEFFPVATVAWSDWQAGNPDGQVLSRDTGVSRDYGRNPYRGYDTYAQTRPFAFEGDLDGRLEPKTKIVGIAEGGEGVAIVHDRLRKERVLTVSLDGTQLVVWLKPGAVSALDHDTIAGGRDIGATGVFVPEANGRALTFRPTAQGFRDEQTGSRWNVLGEAVAGPLRGERLEAVTHVDTFWFAWAAFQPETQIIR